MTFKVLTVSFSAKKGGDDGCFGSSLQINKGDITRWCVDGFSDAIVNSTDTSMLPIGGFVNTAIHRAAGLELLEACYSVPQVQPGVRCPKGEARITQGFKLPAAHVIHTVGPKYEFDISPDTFLRHAYMNCLSVAKANNIKYIAFPAISCGLNGYPYEEAASVAISTVKEFAHDFKEVHFVMSLDEVYNAWMKKAEELLQG